MKPWYPQLQLPLWAGASHHAHKSNHRNILRAIAEAGQLLHLFSWGQTASSFPPLEEKTFWSCGHCHRSLVALIWYLRAAHDFDMQYGHFERLLSTIPSCSLWRSTVIFQILMCLPQGLLFPSGSPRCSCSRQFAGLVQSSINRQQL